MSEERVSIKIQLKYPDKQIFAKRFAPYLGRNSMFLPTRNLKNKGTPIVFEFLLANNQRVFYGEGVVVTTHRPTETSASGMGIQFTALDEESFQLLEKLRQLQIPPSRLVPNVPPTSIQTLVPGGGTKPGPGASLTRQASGSQASPRSGASLARNPGQQQAKDLVERQLQTGPAPSKPPINEKFMFFKGTEDDLPKTGPIIGIDLGTTNSCCAIVEGNRPHVIPSRFGYNTIPSIIAFDERQNLLVGHPAKSQMLLNPRNTVYGSKRLVGRKYRSAIVQFIKNRFHYHIVETQAGDAGVKIEEENLTLQEVSALILMEIKELAQSYLEQPVHRAVISVPAYYNDHQRQAVRQAGLMAGIRVERIVNEPTAAALAYGFGRNLEQTLMVYDLGGGTFDASVLKIHNDLYEVVSTGGNTFLGGVDFDNRLIDYVLAQFQQEHGIDLRKDAVKMQRVRDAVEKAKCELSSQPTTDLTIPYIDIKDGVPLEIQMRLTRELLNSLVEDIVEETLRVCDEVMKAQNLGPDSIDEVVLVGGQTRMPRIHTLISQHFGRTPHRNIHPDEAVALGTAVLAHSIGREEHIKLIDVLAMSIGIGLPGGRFKVIIPRNTKMPYHKSYIISTTRDNQTEQELMLFQGESPRVNENVYLGSLLIDNIPKAPRGQAKFEIHFDLNHEAILTVTSEDLQTGQVKEVVLSTGSTPDDIRQKLDIPKKPEEEVIPEEIATAPKRQRGLMGWLKKLFKK